MIAGIHHINLVVPQNTLEEAAIFYGETLGLTPRAAPALLSGSFLWFDIGTSGQQVHIACGQPEDFSFESLRHPCFRIADAEQLLALRQRIYVHFERGGAGAPKVADKPGEVDSGGFRAEAFPQRFFARDYAGNRLEFSL
ncbi:hypothetical protein GGS21DRAFT_492862 [Xylaria nigripes]|nr:hypothetical protein GGS21DRAFT_492862 [Xylaria nigripes]